ncbi:hypothetical protein AWC38_SpisGene20546 [Stylophora pistillata]|uniref:Uncharacterized protein n=1 Tax=Stylophora pistillata TaxID=50429 RepID=A0A2B4RG32_STYPI|nr:hypothetical protein AWC38_SpisGene20546 [Stylophora pistillata]
MVLKGKNQEHSSDRTNAARKSQNKQVKSFETQNSQRLMDGFTDSRKDESLVSFPEEHQESDPFQELEDSELVQVNSLLRDASCASGIDVPSAGEALKADSTLPTCAEMTANWEEQFFSSLSASTSENSPDDESVEDIIEVNAASKEPKVKSLNEAMVILENVIEYLTSENLSETANDLSKVLSNIQSTWQSRKLKASVQSKVTDFFK